MKHYSNIYIIYVNKKINSQMEIIFGSGDEIIEDIAFELNYSIYEIKDPK